jgi:hypothetical protein
MGMWNVEDDEPRPVCTSFRVVHYCEHMCYGIRRASACVD